jgi:TrmH family RNA methyltransferase
MTRESGAPPIASRQHPVAIRVGKVSRRPALAHRQGVFLLDGIHLLQEALVSPFAPEVILVAPRLEATPVGRELLQGMRRRGWPLLPVTDALLAGLAPTETPQGVLGLFRRGRRAAPPPPSVEAPGACALVLAGVQDPANLGALARAARVFGCPLLITLADTVDPFHPRAARASAGLVLRMAVASEVTPDELRAWRDAGRVRLVSLVPRGGAPPAPTDGPFALVLGSEGQGLPPGVEALCELNWSIPMAGDVDSLGVAAAGAIALFAARRPGAGTS